MTNEVDLILERGGKLSADEILLLVQKLTANLRQKIKTISNDEKKGTMLVYGKYKNSGGKMSTEEDFKLAEYHFNEDEW